MGHPPRDVWSYTPRMITGFLKFAEARRKREVADDLSLAWMAARGDPQEVKKKHKELSK